MDSGLAGVVVSGHPLLGEPLKHSQRSRGEKKKHCRKYPLELPQLGLITKETKAKHKAAGTCEVLASLLGLAWRTRPLQFGDSVSLTAWAAGDKVEVPAVAGDSQGFDARELELREAQVRTVLRHPWCQQWQPRGNGSVIGLHSPSARLAPPGVWLIAQNDAAAHCGAPHLWLGAIVHVGETFSTARWKFGCGLSRDSTSPHHE